MLSVAQLWLTPAPPTPRRDEFARHKAAKPQFLTQFYAEWENYFDTLQRQETSVSAAAFCVARLCSSFTSCECAGSAKQQHLEGTAITPHHAKNQFSAVR